MRACLVGGLIGAVAAAAAATTVAMGCCCCWDAANGTAVCFELNLCVFVCVHKRSFFMVSFK